MCRPLALRNSTPTRFWTSRPFLGKVTTRFRRKVGSGFSWAGRGVSGELTPVVLCALCVRFSPPLCNWCAERESNPPLKLGKLTFYR
jgi:hypothetical protein